MTTTEKGKFYEKGIEFYIRQNPKIYFDNTNVQWNVKLKGNSGVQHQIDILLTTGEKLVVVECKNHQKKIGYDIVAKKSVGIRSKELIRRLFSYCSLQTMRKPTLSYLYRGE